MITVSIGNNKYSFPTQWEEVDIESILECDNPKDLIHKTGKVPMSVLERLDEGQIMSLYGIVSFIDDQESINDVLIDLPVLDIREKSYMDFERARKGIGNNLYKTFFHLCKIYYPEEKKTVLQLSIGVKIINQINVFLSQYEEMFNDKPDPLEVQAGSDRLTAFGVWGTAYNLAGEDLVKHYQIFDLPVADVYTALHYSWTKAQYQKRLMELRNPKK